MQVHSYQAICGTDVEDATATALHASLTPSTSQSSGRFLTFLRPKAAAGKTAGAVQSEGHPNVAALAASGPITNGSTARGGGDWEQNLVMAPAGAVHSTAAEGEGSSSGEAAAAPVGAATAELISFAEDGEEEDGAAGLAPHTGSAKDLLS